MAAVIALAVIFLFSYFAHQFEHKQTVKSIEREINQEIKKGISVRLIDGRIVYTKDISMQDKRMTNEYSFLKNRGKNLTFLDSLDFENLKWEYDFEKDKEKIKIEEKRKFERIKIQEELKRKKEKERKDREILEQKESIKKWEKARVYCENFEINSQSIAAGVYLIHSIHTNDFYIGSSKNLYNRKIQHLSALKNGKHYSYKMQKHFEAFGIDNFSFYFLEKVIRLEGELQRHIEIREQYFIDLLNPSYNYWKNVKEGKLYHLKKNNPSNF